MSRLFISHSSQNNDKAIEVRDWLAKNGWDDVFLDLDPERGIVAGQRWKEALQKAAYRCEVVLALVSKEWLASGWCKSEVDAARLMGKKVIAALVGVDKDAVPPDLTDEQFIDLTGDPQAYLRLKEGLRRAGLDPTTFPFPADRRPYPGFAYLEEQDAAVFFGRDAQIVRGLDEIRRLDRAGVTRVFVILGASGSGKSSFLRAGLWSRLKRDDRAWLPLPIVRPERAAISGKYGLAKSLYETICEPRFERGIGQRGLPCSALDIQDFIEKTDDGLAKLLAALCEIAQSGLSGDDATPPTALLAIDQGEELFNEEGRGEAKRLVDVLTKTLAADARVIAILVMRSDAFPSVQNEPALAALPKNTFNLDMMLEGSFRAVIEGPARLVEPPLAIDPQLTDALLEDISGQDALPLLAFTLAHLYDNTRVNNALTLTGYDKIGRVKGVIDKTVAQAFAEAAARGEAPKDKEKQLKLARSAFIPHLAQVNPAGQFVRRVSPHEKIPNEARPLMDRFAEQRLLIRDRRQDAEVIEVAHEALLRQPPFSDWLAEDREFLMWRDRLIQARTAFEADERGLLAGRELAIARGYMQTRAERDFESADLAFICDSITADDKRRAEEAEERLRREAAEKEEQERRIRDAERIAEERTKAAAAQKRFTLAAVVGLVIALGLAAFAGRQYWKATEATQEAQTQRDIALARQLAAQAETIVSERPNLLQRAVLLALESLKRYPTLEADQVLRQGLPLLPRAISNPINYQGPVQAVAFSPDGTHLATVSRTADVWETTTGRQFLTLKPGQVTAGISDVAFSPSAPFIATADSRGIVQIRSTTDGEPFGQPIKTDPGRKTSVAFSADGNYLATVNEGGADVWQVSADQPKVFSTPSRSPNETFSCSPLSSFVFSPDGKHAAAACRGQVGVFEIATWNTVTTIPYKIRPGLRLPLHPIAFSADGKYLASADNIYDVTTGALVHELYSSGAVSKVAFSRGGYFAMVSGDIVRLVGTTDGASFAELHHANEVRDIAISPNDNEIATASMDGTARIWRVNQYGGNGPTREVARASDKNGISFVKFSPDGAYLATASEGGAVGVWRVRADDETAYKSYGGTDESVVAISPTGRFLAISSKGSVRVLEPVDGREVGRVVYAESSEQSK
jgi:WD40 repeat protein